MRFCGLKGARLKSDAATQTSFKRDTGVQTESSVDMERKARVGFNVRMKGVETIGSQVQRESSSMVSCTLICFGVWIRCVGCFIWL